MQKGISSIKGTCGAVDVFLTHILQNHVTILFMRVTVLIPYLLLSLPSPPSPLSPPLFN